MLYWISQSLSQSPVRIQANLIDWTNQFKLHLTLLISQWVFICHKKQRQSLIKTWAKVLFIPETKVLWTQFRMQLCLLSLLPNNQTSKRMMITKVKTICKICWKKLSRMKRCKRHKKKVEATVLLQVEEWA